MFVESGENIGLSIPRENNASNLYIALSSEIKDAFIVKSRTTLFYQKFG